LPFKSNSSNFSNLKSLKAGDISIGDLAIKALVLSQHLEKLEELLLNGNKITRMGLNFLNNTQNLSSLKKIDLRRNHLLYEDCILLQDSPHFKNLEVVRF
jgi:hypothetical protein